MDLDAIAAHYERFESNRGIVPGRMWEQENIRSAPTPFKPLVACVQNIFREHRIPSGDTFVAGSGYLHSAIALSALSAVDNAVYGMELDNPTFRLGRKNFYTLKGAGVLRPDVRIKSARGNVLNEASYGDVLGKEFGEFSAVYTYDTLSDEIAHMIVDLSDQGTLFLRANHDELLDSTDAPRYFDGLKHLARYTLVDPLTPEGIITGMYVDVYQKPNSPALRVHRQNHHRLPQLVH